MHLCGIQTFQRIINVSYDPTRLKKRGFYDTESHTELKLVSGVINYLFLNHRLISKFYYKSEVMLWIASARVERQLFLALATKKLGGFAALFVLNTEVK